MWVHNSTILKVILWEAQYLASPGPPCFVLLFLVPKKCQWWLFLSLAAAVLGGFGVWQITKTLVISCNLGITLPTWTIQSSPTAFARPRKFEGPFLGKSGRNCQSTNNPVCTMGLPQLCGPKSVQQRWSPNQSAKENTQWHIVTSELVNECLEIRGFNCFHSIFCFTARSYNMKAEGV